MVFLVYFLINVFFTTSVYANEHRVASSFHFEVECGSGEICLSFKKRLNYLELQDDNKIDITKYIGHLFSEGGVHSPVVEFFNDKPSKIKVSFKIKPRIKDVELDISGDDSGIDLSSNLLQPGEIFTSYRERENVKNLKKVLTELGFENSVVNIVKNSSGESIELKYQVQLNQPVILTDIEIDTSNVWIKNQFANFLGGFLNKTFSRTTTYSRIDEYVRQLKGYGFHLLNHEISDELIQPFHRKLKIKIAPGRMYSFGHGDRAIDDDLRRNLIDKLFKFNSEPGVDDVKDNITVYLATFGYRQPQVQVTRYEYVDSEEISHLHFQISLIKGVRTKINNVIFKGNNFLSDDEIKQLFFKEGTDLIGANNFDLSYIQSFSEILTKCSAQ